MSVLKRIGPHLIEKSLIDEPAFCFEQVADVGLEQLACFGEALLEFVEKAHGLLISDRGLRIQNYFPEESNTMPAPDSDGAYRRDNVCSVIRLVQLRQNRGLLHRIPGRPRLSLLLMGIVLGLF